MNRNELITDLQAFLDFLLKNGYCDTDVYSEPPTALDQYLAHIGVNKGIDKPTEEVNARVDKILREAITMVDPNDMGEVYPYIPADDEDLTALVTLIMEQQPISEERIGEKICDHEWKQNPIDLDQDYCTKCPEKRMRY